MNKAYLLGSVMALALVATGQSAFAQDDVDIIVTARRVEERLQDVRDIYVQCRAGLRRGIQNSDTTTHIGRNAG